VLNDILSGRQPEGGLQDRAPVTVECSRCRQPFPSANAALTVCPACIEAQNVAVHRALIADAARSRRNNLIYGSLLIVLGVGVALWTGTTSGTWLIAIGPIAVGVAGVFRGLVS
jgi:hypothetical protein